MPVRRAESLMILRVQCRAPNSLTDSRHQVCLVSDSLMFTACWNDLTYFSTSRPQNASITAATVATSISSAYSTRIIRPNRL